MERALILCLCVILVFSGGRIQAEDFKDEPANILLFDTTVDTMTLMTTSAPEDHGASVSCDSTSMTVLLHRALLENRGGATDVHFEDQSCIGYDYDSSHIAVTTRYDECDTEGEQTPDVIKYSNVVTYFKPSGENGSLITRDFRLKIPVTCELNRRSLLGSSFKPKLGIVTFTEVGYGNFSLALSRFADDTFDPARPVDLEAEVYLGEDMFFGVNLTAVTDLTLLIDRCWATPDVYPMNPTAFSFIKDGCALDETVVFHDQSALFKGFSIAAFAFIGEYPEVYIHCDVLVCDNQDLSSRCAQGCMSRARRSAQGSSRGSSSKPHTISNGPMSSQHAATANGNNDSWFTNPLNMMVVGAAGFFVAMVAMVTVRKLRARRGQSVKGYRRLKTEEAIDKGAMEA